MRAGQEKSSTDGSRGDRAMKVFWRTVLVFVLALALEGAPAVGQVVERERDVTITGPRGRSIERSITSERGPGFVDRQVNIQRPGGTFSSNTMIQRAPSVVRGGGFAPVGRWGGWGPRPFIGREVIINNGGGPASWLAPLAVGLGSFGVGMFAGSALASSPPPVAPPPQPVYAVPPGYVLQPVPGVVAGPPQVGVPAAAPPSAPAPAAMVDPIADPIGRLQSYHANSRRDGAYTLGRIRDPRAIPALIDRLKNDGDADVRIAAATALGEIGDPRAAVYLERVTIYDKKQKVRDAAALALARLPRELAPSPGAGGQAVAANPSPTPPAPGLTPIPSNMLPTPGVTRAAAGAGEPEPVERVPPPPTPATTTSGPGFPQNR
jgi:hypothetical protein